MAGRSGFGLLAALVASVTACDPSESQPVDHAEAGQGASSGGGGGGSAGKGGTGGSATTGGASSGGRSDAGDGGAADGGQSGGAGAAGGAGGDGGRPSDDADVVGLAAVVLGSCYPDDGVSRNAAELWHWREEAGVWQNFRLRAECIAEAGGGCRALDACLGWTLTENASCTAGRTCDGSVFRDCVERTGYPNIEQTLDCATLGLACDPSGICGETPFVACDPETYVDECEANEPGTCRSPGVVRRGPDCGALGLTCVADNAQTGDTIIARCAGTGDACENLSDPLFDGLTCSGSTLDACVNGRGQSFDCATLGERFTCQSHSGIPFCGLASECLPAHLQGWSDRDVPQGGIPEPACDGSSVVFCNAGRIERVDCTTLGFTGCDLEAGYGCVPSPRTELAP